MNTRYCAAENCGKPNHYTAVKPMVCAFCEKPFASAFANLVPAAPVSQPTSTVPTARPRIYRDAKGRDISHLYQQPTPTPRYEEPDDEEYYDQNEMRREADELAASIGESFARSIVANISASHNSTTRMGDILRDKGITPEDLARQEKAVVKGSKKRAKK
jgi:hypothetical protein